jgi:integrase/recombinase XerD
MPEQNSAKKSFIKPLRARARSRDIYNLESKFAGAKRNFAAGASQPTYGKNRIPNPWASREVSPRNRELVLAYEDYQQFQGKSLQTRYKRFCTSASLTQELNKDFDKLTKEDIQHYIAALNDSNLADKTKQVRKITLKLIVKWLAKEQGIKASQGLWAWLNEAVKTTLPTRNAEETLSLDKANLLEEEEALDFIRFCKGRDRAFYFALYESGARIGELLPLKRKDIKFEDGGYVLLTLVGKTGKREVPIKSCVADLGAWLNSIPEDPEQDLWIIEGTNGAGSRYDYRAMMRHTYQIGARWQAHKAKHDPSYTPWGEERLRAKLHLHNWRHSRATICAKAGWSEYEMCVMFGWKIGSKIPGVYIKLTGRDLLNRIRQDHGEKPAEIKQSEMMPSKCPTCQLEQSAANRVCSACGTPLSLREFAVWHKKKRETEKAMADIVGVIMSAGVSRPDAPVTYRQLAAEVKKRGIKLPVGNLE